MAKNKLEDLLKNVKTQVKNPKDLTPFEMNPRRNDDAVAKVVESIKQYGFNQPIVIDQKGRIVVGHTRHKAALALKLKKVPVWQVELTDEEFLAYNLADNKTGEISGWDYDMMKDDLSQLEGSFTGFTQDEIQSIIGSMMNEDLENDLPPVKAEDFEIDDKEEIKLEKPEFGGKGTKQIIISYNDDEYVDVQKLIKKGLKETGKTNASELIVALVNGEV